MRRPTTAPTEPQPVRLVRTARGKYPTYQTPDDRFTVVRNRATDELPYEDSGFTVVDTHRANILGHGHTNTVRVWELDDAETLINRVLHTEWLGDLQAFLDRQQRAAGLPTAAEAGAAAARRERSRIPARRAL